MSQQESIVLEARVEQDSQVHTATYFVEHGVVHARIGDRVRLVPLLGGDADEIVSAFLRSNLATVARESCQSIVRQHSTQAWSRP